MKRIFLIVIASAVLVLGFQNCGGLSQLPVSLGGSQKTFGNLRVNFPFSWSTDTGNFDKSQKPTAQTAVIDLANNICYLYSPQLQLSGKECVTYLLDDPSFINLFHSMNYFYESFAALKSDSNNNLIGFDKKNGDTCLVYIDAHQIQLNSNAQSGLTKPQDAYEYSFKQIYTVVAASEKCSGVIQDMSANPVK